MDLTIKNGNVIRLNQQINGSVVLGTSSINYHKLLVLDGEFQCPSGLPADCKNDPNLGYGSKLGASIGWLMLKIDLNLWSHRSLILTHSHNLEFQLVGVCVSIMFHPPFLHEKGYVPSRN